MDDYSKEKWSADFPDRAGQEVRPTEAVENTLDYDVLFPQYLRKTRSSSISRTGPCPSWSVMMPGSMSGFLLRPLTLMPT